MKLNHPRNLSPVFILNVLAAAEYSDDLQAFAEYIYMELCYQNGHG